MPNPLPWFRLNADAFIDDDTWDLWPVENYGILLKLLIRCWKDPDCSLPADAFALRRKARIEDNPSDDRFVGEEQLEAVLSFFRPHPEFEGRLTHPDLYQQFRHARNLSAVRSEVGKKGGRPATVDSAPDADEKAIAKQLPSNSQPIGKPIAKQLPSKPKAERVEKREERVETSLPTGEKSEAMVSGKTTHSASEASASPTGEVAPIRAIVGLYHEALPELPRVRTLGTRLKTAIQARWREAAERQDLAWWGSYFHAVSQSDFLCGRVEGDARPWRCDLAWLVGPLNIEKVLNGRYENREANPRLRSKAQRVNDATFEAIRQATGPKQIGPADDFFGPSRVEGGDDGAED